MLKISLENPMVLEAKTLKTDFNPSPNQSNQTKGQSNLSFENKSEGHRGWWFTKGGGGAERPRGWSSVQPHR